MSEDTVRIARAIEFAARKHTTQRRKGAASEPYMNHLVDVALLVAESGADTNLIIAAYLHDTIEDQGVTHAELMDAFGYDVANLVKGVTDDKLLSKEERKRQQVQHARHASSRAKVLKIADKVSNLRSILASPPTGWSTERKLAYFDWAAEVVSGCRGVNPWIEAKFDEVYCKRVELPMDQRKKQNILTPFHSTSAEALALKLRDTGLPPTPIPISTSAQSISTHKRDTSYRLTVWERIKGYLLFVLVAWFIVGAVVTALFGKTRDSPQVGDPCGPHYHWILVRSSVADLDMSCEAD